MIRKKRLTAKQQALLLYKVTAPCSVGASLAEVKARAKAIETETIRAVRAYVFLTRFSCQLCRGRRKAECAGREDELHEHPARSKTRGLPPAQRFNLATCARVCAACHVDLTHHRLRIKFADPALGFMGPVSAESVS